MKPKHIKLAREQLDATLGRFEPLKTLVPPGKGWIRAIRDAIGMTGGQLAKRLNINKQRVSRIEHDEKLGKVKIETLRNVAEAMDCVFVYGFVPRKSLDDTLKNQAIHVAKKRMSRVAHTMALEDQVLSRDEQKKAFETAVEELIKTMPKSLWETDK